MRGIVLTELLDFAQKSFPGSEEKLRHAADLRASVNPVASYPDEQVMGLVGELGEITGRPQAELLVAFGSHLFHRFAAIYPVFFQGATEPLGFLSRVNDHVHGDLRRFHPDAKLPQLDCSRPRDGELVLEYRSERPLADLAEGLILGCIDYFGGGVNLERNDPPKANGCASRFVLRTETAAASVSRAPSAARR